MKKIQYRSGKLELRSGEEESKDSFILSGYFAKFNDPTEIWDGVFEQIGPEAFNKCLDKDVRALYDHDTAKVLGRTKNQTLRLSVDDVGLYGEITVNQKDSEALNLYERVKRGDIDQCSFGFYILAEQAEKREDGSLLSTILEVDLIEVSVVTFPAYESTSIEARGKDFIDNEKKQKHLNWQKKMKARFANA